MYLQITTFLFLVYSINIVDCSADENWSWVIYEICYSFSSFSFLKKKMKIETSNPFSKKKKKMMMMMMIYLSMTIYLSMMMTTISILPQIQI